MSANHLSRMMINEPMTPDKWPVMMKWLADNGYRVSFWAQVDFPSVVPSYYTGAENALGFRMATKVQQVQMWMPSGVMTLYGEAIKFEVQLKAQEEKAAKEKEAIDNAQGTDQPAPAIAGRPQDAVDGGGVAG